MNSVFLKRPFLVKKRLPIYYNKYNKKIYASTSKNIVIKKISYDILIDSIITLNTFYTTNTSLLICSSVYANILTNDIALNVISNNDNNIFRKGQFLFTMGLFTNIIGGLIYVKPFNLILFLKYLIVMSLSMGIFTNIRYSFVYFVEKKYKLRNIYSFGLRLCSNILGNIQYFLFTMAIN